jgi:hypothetical protein
MPIAPPSGTETELFHANLLSARIEREFTLLFALQSLTEQPILPISVSLYKGFPPWTCSPKVNR